MKEMFFILLWICLLQCTATRPDVIPQRQDMPLDVNKLESLGRPDALMQSLKDIAQQSHNCGVKEIPKLRRIYLRNDSVTCNDGTRAGYYLRKSHGSKKWIVFLAGGWYCFHKLSCSLRWSSEMRSFMSSHGWPEFRSGSGILSWDPKENPYYFNANIVYVPYCSSDSWTGTVPKNGDNYAFLGSYIVEEVIRDLLPRGLRRARKLFLTGTSAGGTGVLMNLDRVADLMKEMAPTVEVRGIADSGWFVDIPQYRPTSCSEPLSCAPVDGIKLGYNLWKGQVPEGCKAQYAESERWRCYFGYRMYPTLRTPVYIVQYLFDEAQVMASNVIDKSKLMVYDGTNSLLSKKQWEFLHKLGEQVKQTLENVTAVFAPACLSHEVLLKRDWHAVSVNGISLAQSIYCWENSFEGERCLTATNGNTRTAIKICKITDRYGTGTLDGQGPLIIKSVRLIRPYDDAPLKDDPKSTSKKAKKKKKRKKNKNKKRKNRKKKTRRKKNKKKKRRRKNRRRKNKRGKGKKRRRSQRSAKTISNCSHHLIESCPLPQWCNSFCPAFRNVFTRKEIDFFKLFAVSGIDKESIAELLGVEKKSVEAMNANTISELLLDTFRNKKSSGG